MEIAYDRPQELFLIRHATTDMAGTLCGQVDPSLNAIGREQARALAQWLQHRQVRRLYTSDLRRAVQTARPLAGLWDLPILKRPGLREISFGAWEGKRWSEIRTADPDITAMESSPKLGAPGGETFACFRARILFALKQTLAESEGHTSAIVTHLGVMRVILTELVPKNPNWDPRQRIEYCAVYQLRVSGSSFAPAEPSINPIPSRLP
jgi:alpha-ribazole phosphatase/probable phosphoglycerate mutase